GSRGTVRSSPCRTGRGSAWDVTLSENGRAAPRGSQDTPGRAAAKGRGQCTAHRGRRHAQQGSPLLLAGRGGVHPLEDPLPAGHPGADVLEGEGLVAGAAGEVLQVVEVQADDALLLATKWTGQVAEAALRGRGDREGRGGIPQLHKYCKPPQPPHQRR